MSELTPHVTSGTGGTPVPPVVEAKRAMRERLRCDACAAGENVRDAESARISGHLLEWLLERVPARRAVMLYAPMKVEVDVTPVALGLLERGRTVCLPRVNWRDKTMAPVRIEDWSRDLIPDRVNARLGLRSPREELGEIDPAELGAIVVPGVAFDRRGGRLGRGAGFYDRFLGSLPSDTGRSLVGVAFGWQVVERVPMEGHDARMDVLVTAEVVEDFRAR